MCPIYIFRTLCVLRLLQLPCQIQLLLALDVQCLLIKSYQPLPHVKPAKPSEISAKKKKTNTCATHMQVPGIEPRHTCPTTAFIVEMHPMGM